MEFNNEERGLLVSGLLALQDVADKSKSSDTEKQKIGSEIMSAAITSVWEHDKREIFHYAMFALLWYLLYKAEIKNKDLRENIDFLLDHKINIKTTYINATNNEQQEEKKSPDTHAGGSDRDNGSQM